MTTLLPGHPPLADHPLANLFPLLPDKELAELADDIAANGQAETIKLHRGLILDGRNRYRACNLKSLAIRYEIFAGTDRDALNWVISKNLRRRHLSESQRAMVAAKLATLRLGNNQHTQPAPIGAPALPGIEPPAEQPAAIVSQTEAGEMLSVGRRSVQRATVVQEKGAPELQQAVTEGKIAVSTAADIAETVPKDEQTKLAGLSQNDILEAAKKIRKERNDKRRKERVAVIAKQAQNNTEIATVRKFPLIYMDPPTKYEAGDSDRSTENRYATMTEEEIAALPISELATKDAILFIWTTVPWLRKTIRLIEGWGFQYKSATFWDKVDIGLGFWWQNQIEVLMCCVRGHPVAPENGSIMGPGFYTERKGDHSVKPEYFRGCIDGVPEWKNLPKVELFARVDGPMPQGWFAWGNEARVPQQQKLGMDAAESQSDKQPETAEAAE